ncbi:MAG: mycofactocin biosynthesis chaperone MftB [Acidimicrobiales bacterium]
MPFESIDALDESTRLKLSQHVSLRDESFGALAYHHENRRLVFLKSRALAELVRRLGDFDSVGAALDELVASDQRDRYVTALASLHQSGLLSA